MMFKFKFTPIGVRISRPDAEAENGEHFIGIFDVAELVLFLESGQSAFEVKEATCKDATLTRYLSAQ